MQNKTTEVIDTEIGDCLEKINVWVSVLSKLIEIRDKLAAPTESIQIMADMANTFSGVYYKRTDQRPEPLQETPHASQKSTSGVKKNCDIEVNMGPSDMQRGALDAFKDEPSFVSADNDMERLEKHMAEMRELAKRASDARASIEAEEAKVSSEAQVSEVASENTLSNNKIEPHDSKETTFQSDNPFFSKGNPVVFLTPDKLADNKVGPLCRLTTSARNTMLEKMYLTAIKNVELQLGDKVISAADKEALINQTMDQMLEDYIEANQ